MKSFRIVVVLVLALLLPLRGALAATMLCSTPGIATQMQEAPHGHGAHAADGTDAAQGGHAMHHDGCDPALPDAAAPQHDDQNGHSHGCNLCAAGCQAAPLATAPIGVHEAPLTATIAFPTTSAPAPAFHSEGPERPPRSI